MNKKTGRSQVVPRGKIRRFAATIHRRFHPDRIVLFGSYAYGKPTPDSDVDFLVVVGRKADAAALRCALPDEVPVDIIALTRRELQERLALGDEFIRLILEKGETLHEARRKSVG